MTLTDVKLRKIVNLLSDPLQAHVAANLLAIEAKERGVLVSDLIASTLGASASSVPPPESQFSDVGKGRRINSETYGLEATILKETAMAWLVVGPNEEFWLPKSQCEYHGDNQMGQGIFIVPMWLARKKRLHV